MAVKQFALVTGEAFKSTKSMLPIEILKNDHECLNLILEDNEDMKKSMEESIVTRKF
jgi:hypothetical protein